MDTISKCLCERCGYTWWPRSTEPPVRCAGCGSAYWAKPRQRKMVPRSPKPKAPKVYEDWGA